MSEVVRLSAVELSAAKTKSVLAADEGSSVYIFSG